MLKPIITTAFILCFTLTSAQAFNFKSVTDKLKVPTDKVSQELGVSKEQFIACTGTSAPTPKILIAKKATLFPCLKKANPDLTKQLFKKVMGKYKLG
jgi:hypothetical protein